MLKCEKNSKQVKKQKLKGHLQSKMNIINVYHICKKKMISSLSSERSVRIRSQSLKILLMWCLLNFYNLVVWGALAIVLKKCQQIRSLMRTVIHVIKIKPVGSTMHLVIYSNFPK